MSKSNWTLDQLKNSLTKNSEVKAWIVSRENVHRRERYFMMDGAQLVTDQDRDVQQQLISARIFVKLSREGRHGEISKKLFPSLPLQEQIQAAIEAAQQTDHQAWDLPNEIPAQVPLRATADPKMAEDLEGVVGELTGRIERCVAAKRDTLFNSAELFLSNHDRELYLSTGLTHRSAQSRIYVEAAYSFSRKGANGQAESDEYLNTCWSVDLNNLPVEKLFDETSERAQHSLDVQKPTSGNYAVIVDSEVLTTLLNGYISQLTASHSYNALPFIKIGDEFIPSATGDLMTLTLDPSLEFGADSTAISEQGLLQSPLKLVERNRVVATMADKQYGDYLNMRANTTRGNVVVEPGTLGIDGLRKLAPQVIEILQFSGLFADPNSGTFSSEIRLAKLYDNVTGRVSYIKGGSLSGSIRENFKGARFSDQRVKRSHFSSNSVQGQGYYGPEFALLSNVSIVS